MVSAQQRLRRWRVRADSSDRLELGRAVSDISAQLEQERSRRTTLGGAFDSDNGTTVCTPDERIYFPVFRPVG
jgi:hypothetical protein